MFNRSDIKAKGICNDCKSSGDTAEKASGMFREAESFFSFSVNDLQKAKEFYGQTLGLDIKETPEGLELHTDNNTVFLYPKTEPYPGIFHGS